MSVLEGRRAWFTPTVTHPEPEVGIYTIDYGIPQEWVKCSISCPYCRRKLSRATAPMSRIVGIERVADKWAVITQSVPETHGVIGCGRCHVVFTLPKDPDFAEIV